MAEVLQVDPSHPQPHVVARAVAALHAGALIVYPTDTLYAIGGCALDAAAGAAVRAAKGRGDDKPLPVIVADLAQAQMLTRGWGAAAERLADAFWPGPLTLVLPAAAVVPQAVTSGSDTVAVRVPDLALARALASGAGPLVATSANRSGAAPPLTCGEAVREVGSSALLALDAGPGTATPSTIVDLSGPQPRLLRAGAVDWERARQVLG